MNRSESLAALSLALAKAQLQIEFAAKDSSNPHYGSHYADLSSIWSACRGPLAANELAIIQLPSADGNLVRMTTLLLHSSGEWLESDVLQVQARDANPQAIGSCLTYLRRYQLAAIVGVAPTDSDDDAEAAEGKPRVVPANIDPKTGEEVGELSTLPTGWHYLSDYQQHGPWHEWRVLKWDGQGGSLKVSTKLSKIADDARRAYDAHLPVKLEVKLKPNNPGEAYLNGVRVMTPDDVVPSDNIPF
jgi:hypothetical protein